MNVYLQLPGQSLFVLVELPDVELVAARVHAAWIDQKLAAGVASRKSETGEELMVPYDQLSEPARELDRATVRAVYSAIAAYGTAAPTVVRFEATVGHGG